MYEVQEEFERAKEEEREKEKEFKEKEQSIRSHDLLVQQTLIKYNKTLQENEAKRSKAEKKFEEENKLKKAKDDRILELNHEIQVLNERANKLERDVNKMKKYEEFLERVRERNQDEFQDISDILSRYNTLRTSYNDLISKRQKFEEELQEIKAARDSYEKARKDEVLTLNNDIANLQKRIETTDLKKTELQKNLETASRDATEKDLELGIMITAIENLFYRCSVESHSKIQHSRELEKKHVPNANDYNLRAEIASAKLNVIRAYMLDFRRMVEDPDMESILVAAGMKRRRGPKNEQVRQGQGGS